jgi:hypothetical protein
MPDLTKPNHHWLFNTIYKHRKKLVTITRWDGTPYTYSEYSYDIIHEGLNSRVDEHHQWTVFTMYWPGIFAVALYGKE